MATLAQDTFQRANNPTNFGTASDGNTYTYGSAGGATFSVSGNEGIIAAGNDAWALIGSGTAAKVNILVRTAADNVAAVNGITARFSGDGDCYRAVLNGGNTFFLEGLSGFGFPLFDQVSFSYSANQFCWIRLVCDGTTISATVWLDGSSEPGSPTISVTDTTQTGAGSYGVWSNPNGHTVSYDHLTVTDNQSLVTSTRTVPTSAALLQTSTRSIPTSAALLLTSTRTVPTSAALMETRTRTIPTAAALQLTGTRTVPTSAALLGAGTRSVPTAGVLLRTGKRVVPTSAVLSGMSIITYNANVVVRSGVASATVRSGQAHVFIRE